MLAKKNQIFHFLYCASNMVVIYLCCLGEGVVCERAEGTGPEGGSEAAEPNPSKERQVQHGLQKNSGCHSSRNRDSRDG